MIRTVPESSREIAHGLSTNLARLLRELSMDFERRIHRELLLRGYSEIRPAHIAVFSHLGTGAVRVTELAEHARVTQQAMGKMLKEMERLGYIRRDVDSGDKRARKIRLTVLGTQLTIDCLEAHRKTHAYYAEKVGIELLAQLDRDVRETVSRLDLADLPASRASTTAAP